MSHQLSSDFDNFLILQEEGLHKHKAVRTAAFMKDKLAGKISRIGSAGKHIRHVFSYYIAPSRPKTNPFLVRSFRREGAQRGVEKEGISTLN